MQVEQTTKKKIAIIGAGISGLTAAYRLHKQCDITVFEKASAIGGHTATIDVEYGGEQHAIDTGFIVFNDWTYPNFIKLLDELGVASQKTSMGFSVSCETSGLEYSGSGLGGLFCQKKNWFNPTHWQMIRDILRFNKASTSDLLNQRIDATTTLDAYLRAGNYSQAFKDYYLIPMGAAIWSTSTDEMLNFPALFFIRFFKNHGLLSVSNRPQWRTIVGGSKSYLEPLTRDFKDKIVCNANIQTIMRRDDRIFIYRQTSQGDVLDVFDGVLFASHSDEALALLAKPTAGEQKILGAIPYQKNAVVLHTDESLLPHRKRAWSSWNYRLHKGQPESARLTYAMNILQNIQSKHTFCVSLNQTQHINPEKIIQTFEYSHPVFTLEGTWAQLQWSDINEENTWFCGAYWRNGFHEDGVWSALRAVDRMQAFLTSSDPSINLAEQGVRCA